MISATIATEDKDNHIYKLFASEEKEFTNKRASYELSHKNGETTFNVKATDASALRAVLNSISKIMIVYEKVSRVTDGK